MRIAPDVDTMPRFFSRITRFPWAVVDDGAAVRHITKSLRRRVGDLIEIRAGQKGYLARISGISPGLITLEILQETPLLDRTEAVIHLGLCLFDLKEWEAALRSVTELGVAHVHPLVSARSSVRSISRARLERWGAIVMEAVKQCGRRSVPGLHEPMDLDGFVQKASAGWAHRLVALPGAKDILSPVTEGEAGIVIGPEGGLEDGELEMMGRHGFRAVGMGETALRAVTAAIAAVGILGQPCREPGASPRPFSRDP